MAKESKNNEVYKIEICIDNLTKEQYDDMWLKLSDINSKVETKVEMKGGKAEYTNEDSATLPMQNVNNSAFSDKLKAMHNILFKNSFRM